MSEPDAFVAYETPPMPCPACGYVIDRATSADHGEQAPTKGDFGLCIGCACILVYDHEDPENTDLTLRLPKIEEAQELQLMHPNALAALARTQHAIIERLKADNPAWSPPWLEPPPEPTPAP